MYYQYVILPLSLWDQYYYLQFTGREVSSEELSEDGRLWTVERSMKPGFTTSILILLLHLCFDYKTNKEQMEKRGKRAKGLGTKERARIKRKRK